MTYKTAADSFTYIVATDSYLKVNERISTSIYMNRLSSRSRSESSLNLL